MLRGGVVGLSGRDFLLHLPRCGLLSASVHVAECEMSSNCTDKQFSVFSCELKNGANMPNGEVFAKRARFGGLSYYSLRRVVSR